MPPSPTEGQARRRAGMVLLGIVATVVVLLAVLVAAVLTYGPSAPAAPSATTSGTSPGTRSGTSSGTAARPPATTPSAGTTPESGAGSWDVAAENELAARPMLQLPAQAAQPQAMTTQTAGPSIALPEPTQTVGRWIPGGFPATPEGALAQLKALDEIGMHGGDPQIYTRTYRDLSLLGAPDPARTGLIAVLTSLRAHAGLRATGVVPGLEVTYQVTHGLVKGSASQGRYTVVCVLGQLSANYQGHAVSAGVGDCQAMRWTGTDWRISPGPPAAPASSAWPGSAEAVRAGYRELT